MSNCRTLTPFNRTTGKHQRPRATWTGKKRIKLVKQGYDMTAAISVVEKKKGLV